MDPIYINIRVQKKKKKRSYVAWFPKSALNYVAQFSVIDLIEKGPRCERCRVGSELPLKRIDKKEE